MTTWLVTGGAGYIGAHVVRELIQQGITPIVLDNFSAGLRSRIPDDVTIIEADISDRLTVEKTLRDYQVTGVVHLAAKKAAGDSVEIPLYYYTENVAGLIALCEAMQSVGVKNFVYSSSAAVYGTPLVNPITESELLKPDSPYGHTKVIGEWLANDLAISSGMNWIALRYFNVAGAANNALGDNSVNNLIPMVFQALDNGERPKIFGDDYPTPDGTCVRDYIHVEDLAAAHGAAVRLCEKGEANLSINIGRGQGVSVAEVMAAISGVLGKDINPEIVGRRAGDPPASFADVRLSAEKLQWSAQHDLRSMVDSAWSAWRKVIS